MWQIMLHYKFRQLCTTEWWSWSKQLLPGEGRGKKIRWRKVTTIKTFSYSCFNHHFNLPATATAFTDLLVRLLSLPWNQHALTSVLIQTRRVFQSKPHFTSKSCHILISNALKYLTLFLPFWPMSSTIVFFFFKDFIFSFFSPKPPVHSCIFFVVGPSSCGMWNAASAWSGEQCHVRAQDSNQRNTGPPAAERTNLTTRPRGQPLPLCF